jgi:hypothetical protein
MGFGSCTFNCTISYFGTSLQHESSQIRIVEASRCEAPPCSPSTSDALLSSTIHSHCCLWLPCVQLLRQLLSHYVFPAEPCTVSIHSLLSNALCRVSSAQQCTLLGLFRSARHSVAHLCQAMYSAFLLLSAMLSSCSSLLNRAHCLLLNISAYVTTDTNISSSTHPPVAALDDRLVQAHDP